MIYEIYVNNKLVFYPNDEIYSVENAVLDEEIGTAGSLEFDIYNNNPQYDSFVIGLSYVSVYCDDEELFYGKVTEIIDDLDGKKHIYVRGILAELYEVIAPEMTDTFIFNKNIHTYNSGAMKRLFNQYMKTHVCKTDKNHIKVYIQVNTKFIGTIYLCFNDGGAKYRTRITQNGEYIVNATHVWLAGNVTYGGRTSEGYAVRVVDWSFTDEESTLNWNSVILDMPEDATIYPNNLYIDTTFTGDYNMCAYPAAVIENVPNIYYNSNEYTQVFDGYTDIMTELNNKLYSVSDLYPKLYPAIYKDKTKHLFELGSVTISEYGKLSNQPIQKGRNLLDFERNQYFDSACSHLYAYAQNNDTESEEKYLTLKNADQQMDDDAVHGYHSKFLYSMAIELEYGIIEKSVEFTDVETPNDLLNLATDYFKSNNRQYETISATALDLSAVNPELDMFKVGDRVKLSIEDLVDVELPIRAKTTYINDLTKNRIKIGGKIRKKITDIV